MTKLVEFELPDNKKVLVEVNDPYSDELTPVSNPGEIAVTKAQKTFASALENLNPMFEAIKQKFDEMNQPADEVEVKFGLKLSAQLGAVITGGGEASYEITLKWNNK